MKKLQVLEKSVTETSASQNGKLVSLLVQPNSAFFSENMIDLPAVNKSMQKLNYQGEY
jgi:hypothetical protein